MVFLPLTFALAFHFPLDRTGPFQPSPATFQSHYSDEPVSTFGIDLRKYDETNRERETAPVPRVLVLLLNWVEKKGKDASDEGGSDGKMAIGLTRPFSPSKAIILIILPFHPQNAAKRGFMTSPLLLSTLSARC